MNEQDIKVMIHRSIQKLQNQLGELHNLKALTKILSLLSEAVYILSIEKNNSQR